MVLTADQEARLAAWAGDDTTTDGLIAACERAGWLRASVHWNRDSLPRPAFLATVDDWERCASTARDALALAILAALDVEGVGDA